MFTVTLEDKFSQQIPVMTENVRGALRKTINRHAIDLRQYIQSKKLSAEPGYSATLLHHRSGALKRSITAEVTETATSITGRVYSAGDVKYAAIHEFGGEFKTRLGTGKRVPKGKAMATMPMRSFMRTSLAENKVAIIADINAAVRAGLQI